MFRYSGSKRRLLKYLPGPVLGTSVIVEPFAGSLAYSLHYRPRSVVAAESNPLVRGLWEWFRSEATAGDLERMELARVVEKEDARSWALRHGFTEPMTTLMRLQTSGAYVGQLSSMVLYPQHNPGLRVMAGGLGYVRGALRGVLCDYRETEAACGESGAFAFVDPPYLATSGNYKSVGADHGSIEPRAVEDFVLGLRCPGLVTYGDGAQETFPRLKWELAVVRKVPVLRGGGTRDRTEWYARVNY